MWTCCNIPAQDDNGVNLPLIRIPAAHKPVKVNAVPADCFNHGTKHTGTVQFVKNLLKTITEWLEKKFQILIL